MTADGTSPPRPARRSRHPSLEAGGRARPEAPAGRGPSPAGGARDRAHARVMRAKDAMTSPAITVTPQTHCKDAAALM
ncbi:MAG: CBS domain-containing protein, partial [Chloroflexi bacterium]